MNGEPVTPGKLPPLTGLFEILELLREFSAIRDGEGLIVASGQWRARFGSELRGDLEILDIAADELLHLAKELLRERESEGC